MWMNTGLRKLIEYKVPIRGMWQDWNPGDVASENNVPMNDARYDKVR